MKIYKFSKETREKMSKTHKRIGTGKWMKGKKLSEETKRKISKSTKGEKSSCWKGDDAGVGPMHIWVMKQKGKATKYLCSCGKQAKHWSNIDHSYKRDLKDYTAMCVSCHRKWDYKHNRINH